MESSGPALRRTLPGPFAVRSCFQLPAGMVWVQRSRRELPTGSVARLERARSLLEPASVSTRVSVPQIVDPRTLAYRPLRHSGLLFDGLFGGVSQRLLAAAFLELGAFLAELHALPPAGLPGTTLAPRPVWYPADDALEEALSTARASLPLEAAPRLAGWAEAEYTPRLWGVLVHGRFSSASVAWRPDRPGEIAVLGWLEAGDGDPLLDVAQIVGELVEAVVGGFLANSAALALTRSFAEGTGKRVDTAGLCTLVARTIVNHLSVRAWASDGRESLAPYLRGIDNALEPIVTGLAS